ncbi:uncharacterized protein LOC123296465 [Chrysoperla carnea]|uniref:uncharacterized protein LOC123296465 n=1 Tax=Chrysoperla carnea TaxID=189513 RepID=UPI001D06C82D|nr:uncharacterized protein LOC123296465 [Chrysoperla carnea]
MEIQNFQFAGEALADVWNKMVIDGHEVYAEYIPPSKETVEASVSSSQEWYCCHVRESQYLLQIVKCRDSNCCSLYRSNLQSILYNGFMIPPYPLIQENSSIIIPPSTDINVKFAPLLTRLAVNIQPSSQIYDLYCPSIVQEIQNRTCSFCKLYFASKKNLQTHQKVLHPKIPVDSARVRSYYKAIYRREKEASI